MTEFEEKQEKLAVSLFELYHGEGSWEHYEGLQDNYRYDARDVILTHPHLLSVVERVRLWREEREWVEGILLQEACDEALLENWEKFHDEFLPEYEDAVRAAKFDRDTQALAAYHSILSAVD